jgi:hypothetical protein
MYAKSRNKLLRTAVIGAAAGTSLTAVNKGATPRPAEAAAKAGAAGAASATVLRQRLGPVTRRACKTAAAAAAIAVAKTRPLQPVRQIRKAPERGRGASSSRAGRGSLKLVRIGDQMFYQSAKGLRSLAAVGSLRAAASATASAAAAGKTRTGRAVPAGALAQPVPQLGLRNAASGSTAATAGRASARAAAAAAAAARSKRTLAARRHGTGGARARQAGRSGGGLCLYFCRYAQGFGLLVSST